MEFSRLGRELEQDTPVTRFERLATMLADAAGCVHWHLRGFRRERAEGGGHGWMHLTIAGGVAMPCVRCLEPVQVEIAIDREFLLERDERRAATVDTEAEDFDVLAHDKAFKPLELVEDEVIMALPTVARHSRCGMPTTQRAKGRADPPSEHSAPKDNPFAVLGRLRGKATRE